jgi:hypothetical protein
LGEPGKLAKLWLFTKSDTNLPKSDDAAFDWRKDRGPLDTRIPTLNDYSLLIGEILRSIEHFRIFTTGIGLSLFFAPISS